MESPLEPNQTNENMTTTRIRRHFVGSLQEGLASVSDEHFSRIARAVVYLTRRMERSVA